MDNTIVYIGLGYCGLTGAVHMARTGTEVIGYDLDSKVVEDINNGIPKGEEFLSYLDDEVSQLIDEGLLWATNEWDKVKDKNVFIIAVPSEKDGEPYDDIVISVVKKILVQPRKIPSTIIIESTLSPGVGNALIEYATILEMEAGKDFYLAVCPRKDWFADPQKNVATLPRVVGGVTDACSQKACDILSRVSKDIHVTQYDTAELTKALENAFLHIPAMFAHELAMARPDLDVAEAVRLAGLHWRLPTYHIGFGTGGRCVPLGTKYLTYATERHSRSLSIGINAIIQDAVIRSQIADIAERESKDRQGCVLVLGLGYRPNFKDTGLSPGLAIAQDLDVRGVPVFVHDPLFTPDEVKEKFGLHMRSGLYMRSTSGHDSSSTIPWDLISVVLLATPHPQYTSLSSTPSIWYQGQYVLDAQGTWKGQREFFEQRGIEYHQVGDRNWYTLMKERK
jgi:UDP-N-acetyl-D-glucosamine dehydrogenase